MDISVDWGAQGSPITASYLTHWCCSETCCTDRGALPQFVSQWLGWLQHLNKSLPNNAGKNGPISVLRRVYQTVAFLPLNWLHFWFVYLGLNWLGA